MRPAQIPRERMERFIELYEPHAVADDTVLRAITLGHPMICPIVSMGARIGMGRN